MPEPDPDSEPEPGPDPEPDPDPDPGPDPEPDPELAESGYWGFLSLSYNSESEIYDDMYNYAIDYCVNMGYTSYSYHLDHMYWSEWRDIDTPEAYSDRWGVEYQTIWDEEASEEKYQYKELQNVFYVEFYY